MEVHTDSSVISILKEDETGGLEIMKGEEWLRVKPVADTVTSRVVIYGKT
uniref:Isopenicillin N synthase-like Fe(2+) 2OG dioxygenase domain-containing protein n=1 Tax=Brassica oleracea var. oleracea TaxID=109376 RepID=A0A0D3ECH6_BRAOL